MAIQVQGSAGTVAEVETLHRTLRSVVRPIDPKTLGHYRLAHTVPLVATQAANGTLFAFRWANVSNICVLTKLRLSVVQTIAATATLGVRFQVFQARGWTSSDSVGTALTITGHSAKKRTDYPTTLITDVRGSAVAAGLTAGTRTLDPHPVMELGHVQRITTINEAINSQELEVDMAHGNHPLLFEQNEGFIVRGPTTIFGAAGACDLMVDCTWIELAPADW